jgi:hypothetical protein
MPSVLRLFGAICEFDCAVRKPLNAGVGLDVARGLA